MIVYYTVPVAVTVEDDGTVSAVSVCDEDIRRAENYAGSPGERAAMTAAYEAADNTDWPEWSVG